VLTVKVRIRRSMLVHGKWKVIGTSTVTAVNGRFSFSYRPTHKSSYRFVATALGIVAGNTEFTLSTSGARTVRVR
jgi:hypothetical protein